MNLIQKLQTEIEQMEIIVIRQTLDLIKLTDPTIIENLVRQNVNRSIEWCQNHEEEITATWVNEMDKNVAKETQDLLNILNPPPHNVPYSYTNWTNKSTITNTLVFDNFRMGDSPTTQPPVVNPFMRLKTIKPTHPNMFGTTASS